MKKLILILLTLAAAFGLALWAKQDPGYVLIDIQGTTVESSLVFAIVMLVLGFIAVYMGLRFYVNVKSVGKGYRVWRSRRINDKANESLVKGLLELSEGKWSEAEKNVLKYVNKNQPSLLNYLAAARAAQEQGAYERRDLYLKDAHQTTPNADIAVGLTQAQLQLDQNQLEQALATLRRLQQLDPKHKQVLKTLARLYMDLADWEHVVEIIPSLRKRKIFPDTHIEHMEQRAYLALLDQAARQAEQKALQDLWYRIPQAVQEKEAIMVKYIGYLFTVGGSDLAEPLIRNALRKYWSEPLVRYYGLLKSADPKMQLNSAESWLSTHENNAVLLLTLGRLCLRNGLWGKARSYLEASVGAGRLPEAYNELSYLLEKMGENTKAIECYRHGLLNAPGCETSVARDAKVPELEQKSGKPQLLPSNTPSVAV
ncbi:heme biosynthesis HemY N-terminal domain-containing protein [Kaarinaea lacus]